MKYSTMILAIDTILNVALSMPIFGNKRKEDFQIMTDKLISQIEDLKNLITDDKEISKDEKDCCCDILNNMIKRLNKKAGRIEKK